MSSDKLYDRPEICSTYFFPQPYWLLPESEHAGPVDLQLPGGTRIGGYWWKSLEQKPTLLYLHGNGESIADQLGHWPHWASEAGANIFFVDYPGYASSEGEPTFTSCCQAATAALEFLLSQPDSVVPQVVLMGRSVGSIFALDAASRSSSPRVRGLALESGIADLKPRLAMRVPYEHVGIDRDAVNLELDQDFNHQAKLAQLRCPVLIIHTRQDDLVPAENSKHLADWAGSRLYKLILFAHGDHNTIQLINAQAYRSHLASFISFVSSK